MPRPTRIKYNFECKSDSLRAARGRILIVEFVMLGEQYSRYKHGEPNGSGLYDQTARPRTLLTDVECGHSIYRFYYAAAPNGGTVEDCPTAGSFCRIPAVFTLQ